MKAEKILDGLTIAAVGLVGLYYGVYLILCLAGFDSRLMSIFALFVMSLSILPVIFRDRLKKCLKRAFRPLQIIFTALLCIYLVTLAAFWCYIGFDSSKSADNYALAASTIGDTGGDTLVIVFGCRTYDYGPSKTLELRLDEAVKLLDALPDSICVVSGGKGASEPVTEASAMRGYLIEKGIAPERIIEEPESHSTSENIRLTRELVEELGIERSRIIGVSTAFHLPRIESLARRYWQPIEVCASSSPNFALYYVSMVREYLSYIKMTFFDTWTFNF